MNGVGSSQEREESGVEKDDGDKDKGSAGGDEGARTGTKIGELFPPPPRDGSGSDHSPWYELHHVSIIDVSAGTVVAQRPSIKRNKAKVAVPDWSSGAGRHRR